MGSRFFPLAVVWLVGSVAAGGEKAGRAADAVGLTRGLVAHYTFDKDASDSGGKGHHATNHGATPVAGGRLGGAFSFDGTNDFVSIPARATQGLVWSTFALWVKTTQSGARPREQFWANPTLIGAATPGWGSRDFSLMLEKGKVAYFHGLFGGGVDMSWFSAASVNDKRWHHIAVVNQGPWVRLYVDGRLTRGEAFSHGGDARRLGTLSQTAAGSSLGSANLFIGATHDAHGRSHASAFYRGLIDDVRIWNRALSAREIAALCANPAAPPAAPTVGEWPGWRGPRGDGSSEEADVPIRWSPTENILWKMPIAGKGHSSPIVWGDRIFVTTCVAKRKERVLLCLHRRSGRTLWRRVVLTAPLEKINRLNSYASSTPATDGKYVWVSFQDRRHMFVACYDFEGRRVWSRAPGKFHAMHGFCSSPALHRDMVILNGDQDGEAYIVALDKTTGAERWRADRPNRVRSYCPPVILDAAGRKQLVLTGSKCVASYDPDSGKQVWIIDGPTEQFAASLVQTDGVLFATGGWPQLHIIGIRPDGRGNVTKTHVIWHHRKGASYVPSPIAYGKWFFVVSDTGVASCLEARSGKRLWMKRLGRHHSASPVSAGGRLYFLDDDGQTFVLKAGPTFELVNRNPLGEQCRASPAISRGRIYVRSLRHLHCIGPADKGREASGGGPGS